MLKSVAAQPDISSCLKSDIIEVTQPTTFTLRFYPDMIRVKELRDIQEVIAEGDNWVTLAPGRYRFFGTSLQDVRCAKQPE
jgi:hypothetical protein